MAERKGNKTTSTKKKEVLPSEVALDAQERLAEILSDSPRLVSLN